MAKFRNIKNSLIAGEISPAALGRTDLPQYLHACETLRNMIPRLSGGAYRRPGALMEQEIDGATDYAPGLIPFVVSKTEAYCLMFSKLAGGNGYVLASRPTANTSASADSTVSGTHPYLAATAANVATVGYYDEWHDVQYVQSADVLYLVHPRYKPYRISRTAVDTFAIAAFDNGLTGATFRDAWPYLRQNQTAITMAISNAAVGAGRTLTASASFFDASHVGAVFKSDDGAGAYGCCRVTAYISATQVTVENMVAFGSTAARLTWWESAWSDYRGWPRSIAIYSRRIAYGGTKYQPDTIHLTERNDYNQLSEQAHLWSETKGDGTTDPLGDDAFAYTLNSNELNLIQFQSAGDALTVGTLGQDWVLARLVDTDDFNVGNVNASSKTAYGAAYLRVVRAGNELMFADPSGEQIQAFVFNQNEQSYVAEPIQLLFDHYPKVDLSNYTGNRRFRVMAWDRTRKTLWCCDTAGNLFAMTRDRSLGVTAWSTHRMGGYDESVTGGTIGSGGTLTVDPAYYAPRGSVISLAVVPNPLIGTDDVWLAVKQKINGAWKYHVQRIIGKEFPNDTAYKYVNHGNGNYMVDEAVFNTNDYPLAEDYVFAVGTHLRAETPVGMASSANGLFKVNGSAVDGSGNSTLQTNYPPSFTTEAYAVVFGLGYDSIVKPVRIEAGSQIGSAQAAIKRIHKASVRFFRTMSAKAGTSSSNVKQIQFRQGSTPMNKSAEIYTGDKEFQPEGDYDVDGYLYLLQDQPLPFSIVSIVAEGMTYDG